MRPSLLPEIFGFTSRERPGASKKHAQALGAGQGYVEPSSVGKEPHVRAYKVQGSGCRV